MTIENQFLEPELSPIQSVMVNQISEHTLNESLMSAHGYDDEMESALARDVARNGLRVPLIISPDYRVLCGHRRLRAARLAGMSEVPIRQTMTALSMENELKYMVRDNIQSRQLKPRSIEDLIIRLYPDFDALIAQMKRGRRPRGAGQSIFERVSLELGVKRSTVRKIAERRRPGKRRNQGNSLEIATRLVRRVAGIIERSRPADRRQIAQQIRESALFSVLEDVQ